MAKNNVYSISLNKDLEKKLRLTEGETVPKRVYQIIERYFDICTGYAVPEKVLFLEREERRK